MHLTLSMPKKIKNIFFFRIYLFVLSGVSIVSYKGALQKEKRCAWALEVYKGSQEQYNPSLIPVFLSHEITHRLTVQCNNHDQV